MAPRWGRALTQTAAAAPGDATAREPFRKPREPSRIWLRIVEGRLRTGIPPSVALGCWHARYTPRLDEAIMPPCDTSPLHGGRGGLESTPLISQEHFHRFAKVFHQMQAIDDLHRLGSPLTNAIRLQRTPIATDHGDRRMLGEPGRHCGGRALR